ncbi:MAG TPA: hypothetical protein VFT46_07095 [Holophagaceae bacterium]|nr:hypothetical protein [Holophagaceae bacterium]
MSIPNTKQNLTLAEAVVYLSEKGVQTSYRSIKRWIRFGMLQVVKVRGRARWVTRESLDDLVGGTDAE